MAATAEDNGGYQDFPQASFAIPSKEEIEERVALAFNVKDGQQSSGQNDEDPYSRAVKYIEKHRIVEVFQVTMETYPKAGLGLYTISLGLSLNYNYYLACSTCLLKTCTCVSCSWSYHLFTSW